MSGNIIVPANIIEVRQGDTFNINFQLRKDCRDYNLTGTDIILTVRDKSSLLTKISKKADGVDLTHGKMVLQILPQDTNSLLVGDYDCTIKVNMPNGDVHTIFPDDPRKIGIFRVTAKI